VSIDFCIDLMATLGILVTLTSGITFFIFGGAWVCDAIERFQRTCRTTDENDRFLTVLSDRVRAVEKQLSELKKAKPKRGTK
jgi:hypothetical protein